MLFLGAVAVLATLVAVLVFGDSPAFRNTRVHALHIRLITCSTAASAVLRSHPSIYAGLRWSVPLFYAGVMGTCFVQFCLHVFPDLPAYHTPFVVSAMASVVIATELVVFSDPGTVTADCVQNALAEYPPNGLIFWDKFCSTCRLQKPARSKHCSVCGTCISLYDHHCIWVNNCIGKRNYRWFLLYLAANIWTMVYGGFLCHGVLVHSGDGLWHTITRTTESHKRAGILMILAGIFSVITAAFTALHLRYIYLGVTTNEADKWGEIEHLVGLGVLFYAPDLGVYLEQSMVKTGSVYTPVYISLKDEALVMESGSGLQPVRSMQDLDNIYDHGFVANLRERLSG